MKRVWRLIAIVLSFSMILVVSPVDVVAVSVTESTTIALGIIPRYAVSNTDGSLLFISEQDNNRVYHINTQTFEYSYINFDLMPEAMFYRNGRLYVALVTSFRSSMWWTEDQRGAFAIVDVATFTLVAQHDINLDPYSIVVSSGGNIYISSGSGQWTDIVGFRPDGTELTRWGGVRQSSTIRYNSALNRIYSITSDLSPRNMQALSLLDNGSIASSRTWRYHGHFSSLTNFEISPDGRFIFNAIGYKLSLSENIEEDMARVEGLNIHPFNDIAFGYNVYYVASQDRAVHSFCFDTHAHIESVAVTSGVPTNVFLNDNNIIVISEAQNADFSIERISRVPANIGDVNADGRLTSADATIIARYLAGHFDDIPYHFTQTDSWQRIADVNCDGYVTGEDVIRLVQVLFGHFSALCPYDGCFRCE